MVSDLTVRFDMRGGFFGRVNRRVHAVEGVSFSHRAGRDAGAGRRIRLRQVDHRPRRLLGLVPYTGDIAIGGRNLAGLGRDATQGRFAATSR